MEKGYTSGAWAKTQQTWSTKPPVVAWKKKFVTALHEYAYSLWKKQNMFIHGDNLKGNRK